MRSRYGAAALGGLAAGLLAVGLGDASAAGGKPTIQWRTWEEAVKEASARNVPIFVSFHKDN